MRLTAGQIGDIVGGKVVVADVTVGPDVVLDSRLATPGAMFVAIKGARVDGHDFVAAAVERGAVAALVSHDVGCAATQIVVADVEAALTALARHIADEAIAAGMTILALTGSSGKTSTKDMLAQVLEPVGQTVSPRGSYNSELGLPITVTAVDDKTRFLVAEMGASKIGQIKWLCSIARPTVAAVLNVGSAHLGEFGSRAAIAQAKGEIVEALSPNGWAVLNADDPLVAAMAARTAAGVVWFCPSGRAPAGCQRWVGATDVLLDDLGRASFRLVGRWPSGDFSEPVTLRTIGAHQVDNACAAAGLALCAGVAPAVIAEGLSAAVARSAWRMEARHLRGGTLLLNDAYNANPDSVAAALHAVRHIVGARPGATAVAVLGDMLELGDAAPAAHQAIGEQAAMAGVEVVAVGQFAPDIAQGARRAGGQAHALSPGDVADWLGSKSFDIVLVKGSRGMGLETVAGTLVARRGEETQ